MSDLSIQESKSKCVPVRKASLAYGNEFLTDTSSSDQPYPGAWGFILVPSQYPEFPAKLQYKYYNSPAVNNESLKESLEVFKSDRPEKKNSFTQENLLADQEEQLIELILRLTTSLRMPYRESLANSLLTLFRDAKEEDPNSPGIAVGSLRYFFIFLQSNTTLKCPTVSLTPEYNIYSTWREEKKRLFSVHFLPNGDVRFVIFKPNDKHPDRKIRISGTATTDVLVETVAPYGVWEWISA